MKVILTDLYISEFLDENGGIIETLDGKRLLLQESSKNLKLGQKILKAQR